MGEATEPMGTGARGLRKVMEGVLEEGMFEAPGTLYYLVCDGWGGINSSAATREGDAVADRFLQILGSSIKHILITEAVARRRAPLIYLARGQQGKFHALIAAEEEEWDRRQTVTEEGDKGKGDDGEDGQEGGEAEEKAGEAGGDQGAASFEEYRERSRSAGVM